DLAVANKSGWTPLNSACDSGHLEIVQLLLEKGADLAVANKSGWTPLNSACDSGHLEIVQLLLEKGADLAVANKSGWTPLHAACNSGHLEVVRLITSRMMLEQLDLITGLPKEPEYVNTTDSLNRTPLHIAIYYEFVDIVQILIKNGANPRL
ncbi:ankyrin repeat-containing domain protein, partial [Bisporella sp. PMI_857]